MVDPTPQHCGAADLVLPVSVSWRMKMQDFVLVNTYGQVFVRAKYAWHGERFFHPHVFNFQFNQCQLFEEMTDAEEFAKEHRLVAIPKRFSHVIDKFAEEKKQRADKEKKRVAESKIVSISSPRPMLRKKGSEEWDIVSFDIFTPTHLMISSGVVWGIVGETGDAGYPYYSYEGEEYCYLENIYTYNPSEASCNESKTEEQEN